MSTRSSARNLFPPLDNLELTIQTRSRSDPTLLNNSKMAAEGNDDLPATKFGLKNDMIQQVQNSCQFHGLPGDDANKHLDKFLHVTQSIKVNGVTDDALRLYLFPHSLTHRATAWFDRLQRNSINTFEQMAKMFLGKYFPPSMVTKLRNEITNFRQRPDESLFEAWERYKLSIDRCPNHNMLPVTQIDTFYNGLTLRHRDTINAAVGGTFMKRPLKAEMAEINKNLMRVLHVNQQVKAVTPSCETCGGPRSFSDCPTTVGNTQNIYVAGAYQGIKETIILRGITREETSSSRELTKANDAIIKNMQTNMTSLTNSNIELKNMFGQFMKMNTASSLGSRTLPGNTITNPKEDLKGITTRGGTAYQGPTIPTTFSSSFSPVVERKTEATKDTVHPTNNGSTEDVQPPVVPAESLILNSEPINFPIIEVVASPVSASRPNQRPSIPYPSRLHDQKLRDKANDQRENFFQIFKDLNFNISFADALILMPKTLLNEHCSVVLLRKLLEKLGDPDKFLIPYFNVDPRVPLILERSFLKTGRALIDVFKANYNDMTANRIDVIDMDYEEYSQEVLGFFDVIAIGNPTPYYDLIFSTTSSTLTPFGNSDFLLEEVDAFLALEDDPTSPEVDQSYVDSEGDILLLEAFLNDDPLLPPPNQGNYLPEVRKELKICEAKSDKSSIDEPPEVELNDLPPHLEYAFLEGDDKLPVIIVKDFSVEEKTALIKVLKSHKQAIAWKLSDIKGIDPEFCTHKILMEEDFEPTVQHQRGVNPKIYDVIKQEVLKLLDAGLIYPIFDSPWVSPLHCVPKKGGFTVVENEKNKLILTRLVTGWRVYIDYRKLNEATRKDHFPLPFMDQMLERLAGNQYYCFLDGLSGYFQIPIDLKDQEKTHSLAHVECLLTDACLLGYAMHRVRFREKNRFMVKEGIVLGYKISKEGIEVDKAKVDVITKLPHPTTVKVIRSFLGHAGFYRRFIKDF
nr:reverse transcriptase domain-containing protein [Tanacetum cinerariifolium]